MKRIKREYFEIISSHGCEIVSTRCNKHLVIKFRDQDGAIRSVVAAATPSDWRATKNFSSTVSKLLGA